MGEVVNYVFGVGLFAVCFLIEITALILGRKRVPRYSYERASKVCSRFQKGDRWYHTLLALLLVDIVGWLWLGGKLPFYESLAIFIGINMLFILLAAGEYQEITLARKRVKELEAQGLSTGKE
ncbi:MAG TPA: hypothetical protein VK140_07355 [Ktedonobacteraceae bacterium]|nr:hypothetical protein [Ktedonobacteraceae bacterium]